MRYDAHITIKNIFFKQKSDTKYTFVCGVTNVFIETFTIFSIFSLIFFLESIKPSSAGLNVMFIKVMFLFFSVNDTEFKTMVITTVGKTRETREKKTSKHFLPYENQNQSFPIRYTRLKTKSFLCFVCLHSRRLNSFHDSMSRKKKCRKNSLKLDSVEK